MGHPKTKRVKMKAVTLTELLIVLLIVSILYAIAIPELTPCIDKIKELFG